MDDNDNRDTDLCNVLLIPQLAVRGQKNREAGPNRRPEQDAVPQMEPSLRVNGDDVKPRQLPG